MSSVRSTYRIQKTIDDWLEIKAKKNNRSKNGELNFLLKQIQESEKNEEAA